MPRDNRCMHMAHVCFYVCCSECVGGLWECLAKFFCQYGSIYLLAACVCGCDGDVICVGHDLNRCTGWW